MKLEHLSSAKFPSTYEHAPFHHVYSIITIHIDQDHLLNGTFKTIYGLRKSGEHVTPPKQKSNHLPPPHECD